MKQILTTVTALSLTMGLMLATGLTAQAGVDPEVQKDIDEYQGWFKKRFPTVPLEAYNDGVNSLPQYAERRANWEIIMEFPPYEAEMETAYELWAAPFKNGKTYADCFANNPPAAKYPYYDNDKKDLITVEMDINNCLTANGEEPFTTKKMMRGNMALLVAAFREQANGEIIAPDVEGAEALDWYRQGRQFYWAKRGQLNFSCANCHVHNAGNKLRGDVLSAGLGHTSGFPVYRTVWATKGKPWGTVHRRYAGCNKQVRAKPYKAQSKPYRAMEYYETVMNTGIPLKVPSQRQ